MRTVVEKTSRRKQHTPRVGTQWIGAILVGVVIAFLVVTFTSEKGTKKNKTQIIIGITQEPDSLDPLFYEMMASQEMNGLLFEGLIERDEHWKLHPRLATQIPSIENGLIKDLPGNRIEVTWHLKEGLKWSDGAPLTVDDFIFAYHMIMDNRLPVISRDLERRVEKMRAIDHHTLIVTWKEPYAYANLGHTALPKHLLESIYIQNPEKYHESFYNRHPIGNGPYQLEEWSAGSHLIFSRNPHWAGQKPKFKKIIYKIIPNTNALESNLLSGTIDAIGSLGLDLDQALDFERRHGTNFKFYYRPSLTWEHIDCNLDNPILKDKRVRQALLHGANRQQMVTVLFEGKLEVADSWLPPKHYGFNPDIKHYTYNPEKAKALLEEAGWEMTPTGIREKAGEKLRLTIMTTAGNKTREQVQQLLQADWKKIGIELEIVNQPPKVYFGETIRKRKFKHLAMYASIFGPISDGESSWTMENIPSERNNWQGQNTTGWVHQTASELLHKVPITLKEEMRKEFLRQQQRLWAEEIPALPLYFRTEISVTHKSLQNWAMTGSNAPLTWNAEQWYFSE